MVDDPAGSASRPLVEAHGPGGEADLHRHIATAPKSIARDCDREFPTRTDACHDRFDR